MADLDYAEVRGRLAVTVGDTDIDPDLNPDVQWCDEGIVRFTPLLTSVHVIDQTDGPFTAGNAPIEAIIGTDGRLTYNGDPFVMLIDLGSSKVNPNLARNVAAYRVDFLNIRSQGMAVSFASFSFHPLPGVVNDLTLLAPLPVGSGNAITQGPVGEIGPEGPQGDVGPMGVSNFVVEENGVYPTRPTLEPVVFVGESNPDALGLMLPGDAWIKPNEAEDVPSYALLVGGVVQDINLPARLAGTAILIDTDGAPYFENGA